MRFAFAMRTMRDELVSERKNALRLRLSEMKIKNAPDVKFFALSLLLRY